MIPRSRSAFAVAVLVALVPFGRMSETARHVNQAEPDSASVPTFRGTPERTGEHPGPGPTGIPGVLWTVRFDENVVSSPAVVDDVVYVGGRDGALYALHGRTGEELWRFVTNRPVHSSPTVVNGVVYVGSLDGFLYAVNAETGEQRWRFQTNDSIRSSPAAVNGVIYVGSEDGTIYAVDEATGVQRWAFPIGYPVRSSPAVAAGTVYVAAANPAGIPGAVYALDAGTGVERWRYDYEADFDYASPIVMGGEVYVMTERIDVLDVRTGSLLRTLEEVTPRFGLPALVDGAFFGPTSGGDELLALDIESGTERWRIAIPLDCESADFYVFGPYGDSSPIVSQGMVYVSGGVCLQAIDAATGVEHWHLKTGGSGVPHSPAVAGGVIYVAGGDDFYAIGS
jgi:eukaryotic-like serine/threonine-protein kinase